MLITNELYSLDHLEIAKLQINEKEFFTNVSNCPNLLNKWCKSEDIFIKGKINPVNVKIAISFPSSNAFFTTEQEKCFEMG